MNIYSESPIQKDIHETPHPADRRLSAEYDPMNTLNRSSTGQQDGTSRQIGRHPSIHAPWLFHPSFGEKVTGRIMVSKLLIKIEAPQGKFFEPGAAVLSSPSSVFTVRQNDTWFHCSQSLPTTACILHSVHLAEIALNMFNTGHVSTKLKLAP